VASRARSLKALREVLDAFQSQYDELVWEPVEVEVDEEGFERMDITRPMEVISMMPSGAYIKWPQTKWPK
jgi:hypothetical protein